MNYRIIETNSAANLPDVLLYRDRDERGLETVRIMAIGRNEADDNDDHFAIEEITFPNVDLARAFIRDFTEKAAIEFCERNDVIYS